MQLNQNYVMSDAAYTDSTKQKEVEQIEKLSGELLTREKQLLAMKENAIKQEDSDMKEIMKKIRENCTLVEMVNDTKLEEKRLEMEIETLNQ